MRTKTLLLSAAAIAAGVVASQAQSNVYSANVVGYVNVSLPGNTFVMAATPMDDSANSTIGSNDLNTLLPALPNKSTVQIWNGAGFSSSTKGASGWAPNLALPPGTGYFISAAGTATSSNVYVGQVVVGFGGSVTNPLPAGLLQLVGSPVPFSDTLNGTNLNLISLPNKSTVQVWNGAGFTPSTKGASGWSPNLTITPGEGFFVSSQSATNWVQTLPAQ